MKTKNIIRSLTWIGIITLAGCSSGGSSPGGDSSNQGGSAGDMSSNGVAGDGGSSDGVGGSNDNGGESSIGGSNDNGGESSIGGSDDSGGTGGTPDSGGGAGGVGGTPESGGTGGTPDSGGTGGTGGTPDSGGTGGTGGSDPGGCGVDTDCPLGQVCDAGTCVDGCGPPQGGLPEEADSERCPIGQACVPFNCFGDPQQCSYSCETLCANWPCHSDANHSYICWGRSTFIKACMQECVTNSNCPDGEECLSHSSLPAEQQGGDLRLCRAPCTTNDDCLTMHVPNFIGYGNCTCQGPGLVGEGHCLKNPTAAGGLTCKYTEPP